MGGYLLPPLQIKVIFSYPSQRNIKKLLSLHRRRKMNHHHCTMGKLQWGYQIWNFSHPRQFYAKMSLSLSNSLIFVFISFVKEKKSIFFILWAHFAERYFLRPISLLNICVNLGFGVEDFMLQNFGTFWVTSMEK